MPGDSTARRTRGYFQGTISASKKENLAWVKFIEEVLDQVSASWTITVFIDALTVSIDLMFVFNTRHVAASTS
jgi:hypothetical protein